LDHQEYLPFLFGTVLKRDHFATSIAANIRQSTRFGSVHNAIINQRIWALSYFKATVGFTPGQESASEAPRFKFSDKN
jgi:fructose-1,6-bisphosphatase/inositol monophosphatase family enzyme